MGDALLKLLTVHVLLLAHPDRVLALRGAGRQYPEGFVLRIVRSPERQQHQVLPSDRFRELAGSGFRTEVDFTRACRRSADERQACCEWK